MKKVLLTMALALMTSLAVNAQQDIRSMYWSPEKHEKVLGSNIFFRLKELFTKIRIPSITMMGIRTKKYIRYFSTKLNKTIPIVQI